MRHKMNMCETVFVVFLPLLMVMAVLPMANAATATLTPTFQAPGGSVTVNGTGFGAEKTVGIGFGAEVDVVNEVMSTFGPYGVSGGPYYGNTAYFPVKPGTFNMSIQVGGSSLRLFMDVAGNGTLNVASLFSASVVNATIDYATGRFTSFWVDAVPAENQAFPHIVNYVRCGYNVTPAGSLNASSLGTFSANFTVPTVANGNYSVTAIDTNGNLATSRLGVDVTIPEGLSIGVMLLLSSAAIIVGPRYFRKQPNR